MRLGLPRLQKNNIEFKKLRKNLLEDQKDVKKISIIKAFYMSLKLFILK